MTWIDDLGTFFGELARSIQSTNIIDLIGLVIVIVLSLLGFGLFLLLIARMILKHREYVDPSNAIGVFKLGMRNESFLIGNVNRNKTFLVPEVLERMKRMPEYIQKPEWKEGITSLERLWKKGLLYAYDMRVFEQLKADLPDNDILLLSPVPLEDSTISWQDLKGERSFTGSFSDIFKRYPKNVFCSEFTKRIDVHDIHGFKKRVYVLAPYAQAVNEQLEAHPEEVRVVKDSWRDRTAYINVISLPNQEALAWIATYLPSLNSLYAELEVRDQTLKNIEEQRDRYNKLADDLKMQIEGWKARFKTHELIGEGKPIVPVEPKSLLFIAIIAGIAGFAAKSISLMQVFARYQGIDLVFFIGFMVVVLAGIKMFEKREKQQVFTTETPGMM